MTFRAFARVLALAMVTALAAAATPAATPLPGDSVYRLPATLEDQDGRRFDWRTRRGRVQVAAMFYTSCKFVCPLIVDSGKAVEKTLTPAQRARVGILLISMDPARDTPAALRVIADRRKLARDGWTLARPAPADVRSIASVLGIRYRLLADGEFNHTSALVLLDAEGRILARTEQVGPQLDPEFLAKVQAALSAPARAPTQR